jgi:hypothetical protein
MGKRTDARPPVGAYPHSPEALLASALASLPTWVTACLNASPDSQAACLSIFRYLTDLIPTSPEDPTPLSVTCLRAACGAYPRSSFETALFLDELLYPAASFVGWHVFLRRRGRPIVWEPFSGPLHTWLISCPTPPVILPRPEAVFGRPDPAFVRSMFRARILQMSATSGVAAP